MNGMDVLSNPMNRVFRLPYIDTPISFITIISHNVEVSTV